MVIGLSTFCQYSGLFFDKTAESKNTIIRLYPAEQRIVIFIGSAHTALAPGVGAADPVPFVKKESSALVFLHQFHIDETGKLFLPEAKNEVGERYFR